MDCKVCDKLFGKIKDIDATVELAEIQKDYYRNILDYMRVVGVHKDAIRMIQERYESKHLDWMIIKQKQQKRHKKLTNHYREDHLNG